MRGLIGLSLLLSFNWVFCADYLVLHNGQRFVFSGDLEEKGNTIQFKDAEGRLHSVRKEWVMSVEREQPNKKMGTKMPTSDWTQEVGKNDPERTGATEGESLGSAGMGATANYGSSGILIDHRSRRATTTSSSRIEQLESDNEWHEESARAIRQAHQMDVSLEGRTESNRRIQEHKEEVKKNKKKISRIRNQDRKNKRR